ncbi:tail fiber domain-containing protein [Pseudomonas putida]|nr:tail fiber domain-containing protein [Pseudomonas putida]
MTTYATGNPLGSMSAKDLLDNAQNLDFFMNGKEQGYLNRYFEYRISYFGMEVAFREAQSYRDEAFKYAIRNSGFKLLGEYAPGVTLTTYNQVVRYQGELYGLATATEAPYTLTGVWAADAVHLISRGDAALRQDINNLGTKMIPHNSGQPGSVGQTAYLKLAEIGSTPGDFGAKGDNVTNDTSRYMTAEAGSDVLRLPDGKIYALDAGYTPSKMVVGGGKIRIGSTIFTGPEMMYDIFRTSLYLTPESYTDEIGFPGGDQGNLTVMISPGGKKTGKLNRCTFYGTQGPRQAIELNRCEGIGNGTLMFTQFAERATAVGTIAFQYLGCSDPGANNHGWWSNAGGFTPGQVGWDYQGMETRNPGIGAKIAAFDGYATKVTDVGRSVAVGRNAFNGTVLARGCLALGYRAGAGCFAVENLTCLGSDVFRDGVFLSYSVGYGTFAGARWQEGSRNTVGGYNAAANTIRGSNNTLDGAFAGYDFADLNGVILIGVGAGNAIGGSSLSNVLAIGPDGYAPLISGRLGEFAAGVNIMPADIRGTFHVKTATFGADTLAHPAADDLIVENGVNCGITVRSNSAGSSSVMFADPESPNVGGVIYDHAGDTLTLRAANNDRWRVSSTSLAPSADNSYTLGEPSFRPSQLFAATSTIGLSDASLKDLRGELTEQELAAWSRVRQVIFRFKDAIKAKGGAARLHAGHLAQQVRESFAAEGLEASDYALWCEDEVFVRVVRTRTSTRQKMVEIEKPVCEIQVIDGIPTQVKSTRTTTEPLFDHLQVFDESGVALTRMVPAEVNPQNVGPGGYAVDVDGRPAMVEQAVTHAVPVMEEYEEKYEELESSGTVLGLRYEQCLVFETAYLRSLIANQDERIHTEIAFLKSLIEDQQERIRVLEAA